MKANETKQLSKTMRILRAILIAALFINPLYFGIKTARQLYRSSEQATHIHQYWLPASAEFTTDKEMWEKKLEGKDVEVIHDFNRYKSAFGDQKHTVLVENGKATYVTFHGKMVMRSLDRFDDSPMGTAVQGFKYLGSGKVEWKLERNWLSMIITPVIAGAVGGALGDAVILLAAFIIMIICTKIKDRREEKVDKCFDFVADAHTEKNGQICGKYRVYYQGQMSCERTIKCAFVGGLRQAISTMTANETPTFEALINTELQGLIEESNRKIADAGCKITKVEILEVQYLAPTFLHG